MSLSTGLGRRAVRTSSPRPRRNPGPSRSPSSKTSGSVAARRAVTVGRCRETIHGWTETGSRGRSGQAATALPSLAQLSALSHHCAHAPGAAGNDQDRYVMTALACHSRGSMPAGCVCHVHTHPRLASWTVTMSLHGTTGNGVSRAAMPHGNATAHSVRPPLTPPLGVLLLAPLPPLPAPTFRGPGRGPGCGPG